MKNTLELINAMMQISIMLVQLFKDGKKADSFQIILEKILLDEKLKGAMVAAYNDIEEVPKELKDIGFLGTMKLMGNIAPAFLDLIKAIRK